VRPNWVANHLHELPGLGHQGFFSALQQQQQQVLVKPMHSAVILLQ
jgi:hypothetical protein